MMHNKSIMIRCYRIVKIKKYLYFTNIPVPKNNNRNYTNIPMIVVTMTYLYYVIIIYNTFNTFQL